jgi:hypothetical protein
LLRLFSEHYDWVCDVGRGLLVLQKSNEDVSSVEKQSRCGASFNLPFCTRLFVKQLRVLVQQMQSVDEG